MPVPAPPTSGITTIGQEMKAFFSNLLLTGKLNAAMIANLRDPNYCSVNLGASYPIIVDITTDSFAFSDYNNLNMTGMRDIEWMNNWIELPSLESLVLGNPNSPSNNFYDASLQLKSGIEFYFLSRFPFSCWSNSW